MNRLILLMLLLGWLTGCQTDSDRIPPAIIQAKVTAPAPELSLNNGQKWEADAAATDGIQNMTQLLYHFAYLEDYDSPEAYQELGNALQGELDLIYQNCTMTGPAHSELHKFLVPVEKDIRLLQGKNLEETGSTLIRLEDRLLTYNSYFE